MSGMHPALFAPSDLNPGIATETAGRGTRDHSTLKARTPENGQSGPREARQGPNMATDPGQDRRLQAVRGGGHRGWNTGT